MYTMEMPWVSNCGERLSLSVGEVPKIWLVYGGAPHLIVSRGISPSHPISSQLTQKIERKS